MTKTQLENRRKIAKAVGISLPVAGFLIPFYYFGVKDKDLKTGAVAGVFGAIFGLVLSAGAVMLIMPSSEQQNKVK